jgi:hypothetical protein
MLNCFTLCLEYGYYTQEKSNNCALKEKTQVTVREISAGIDNSCVVKLFKIHSETGSSK